MKIKLILFFVILSITQKSFSQWTLFNSGANVTLYSVCFKDQNTGWATGWYQQSFGKVVSTTNGGLNWITTSIAIQYPYSIFFIDYNTGWVVGFNGPRAIKTTNGGISWLNINISNFTGFLFSIYFLNKDTGWVVGSQQEIIKTTNGGTNWIIQHGNSNYSCSLNSIFFIDKNSGWCVGGDENFRDTILTTSNGGLNWLAKPNVISKELYSVCFINHTTGWCVGYGGNVIKTTNAGQNWSIQSLGDYRLKSVYFSDSNNGWISGQNSSGVIFRTFDGGFNWYPQYSGGFDLYSMSFINANTGWAVGYNGNILKTTNGGGVVSVNNTSSEIPLHFSVSQNYPNPFNPVTKIRFDIAGTSESQTNISIFDILGNKIATLVNEKLTPGSFEIDFDGTKLSSGVYFYMFTSFNSKGRFTKTMKMALIK
ncbi:MAG: T9SS type A sorting domain-containing protein [Ignavibacteria bacterium]|nr:T9SS type A sorting domain-containing protein [Ignavibacteria bacterium]